MTRSAVQSNTNNFTISEDSPGVSKIVFKGRLDAGKAGPLLRQVSRLFEKNKTRSVIADLKNVTYIDDFGALVLVALKQEIESKDGKLILEHLDDRARSVLHWVHFDDLNECRPILPKKPPNVIIRLGRATILQAFSIRYLVSFLGSVCLSFLHAIRHPKSLRLGDTITYMDKTGVDALPIVALISFLLGLVIAFTSSIQLEQFGANIYVASLVAFAMVSELGPIMTAIVVAGRSGSAYAAEIGTMRINEEIDALFVMGFQPTLFLAVPRIIASALVVPLLTLFSDMFAIIGGMLVGIFILDLTPTSYITQTFEALTLFELLWGLSKSLVFALIIGWIGCLRGFQVRGGAAAVGNAATSAVVSSIFLIILFDSAFAIIRSYWN